MPDPCHYLFKDIGHVARSPEVRNCGCARHTLWPHQPSPVLGGGQLQVAGRRGDQPHPQAEPLQERYIVGTGEPGPAGLPEGVPPGGEPRHLRRLGPEDGLPGLRADHAAGGIHPLQGIGRRLAQDGTVPSRERPERLVDRERRGERTDAVVDQDGRVGRLGQGGQGRLDGVLAGFPALDDPEGKHEGPGPDLLQAVARHGQGDAPQGGHPRHQEGLDGRLEEWDAAPVAELLGNTAPHAQAPAPGRDQEVGRLSSGG